MCWFHECYHGGYTHLERRRTRRHIVWGNIFKVANSNDIIRNINIKPLPLCAILKMSFKMGSMCVMAATPSESISGWRKQPKVNGNGRELSNATGSGISEQTNDSPWDMSNEAILVLNT